MALQLCSHAFWMVPHLTLCYKQHELVGVLLTHLALFHTTISPSRMQVVCRTCKRTAIMRVWPATHDSD
jgi:hypothetical protein